MCDPLSIAGGVMAVGSMGANMMGANAQSRARNRVNSAERARQTALEEQSRTEFNRVLPQVGAEGTQASTAEAQARRTAEGEAAITSAPNPAMPAAGSAPTVVNDSYSRAMSAALRRGLERARAQAAVGAYGDAGLNNNIALARSGQEQARIGTAAQRSSQILPMELEAANQAGGGWRALGGLLGVGGQVAGAAGSRGLSIFGTNPVGAAARTATMGTGGMFPVGAMSPTWGSIFGGGR